MSNIDELKRLNESFGKLVDACDVDVFNSIRYDVLKIQQLIDAAIQQIEQPVPDDVQDAIEYYTDLKERVDRAIHYHAAKGMPTHGYDEQSKHYGLAIRALAALTAQPCDMCESWQSWLAQVRPTTIGEPWPFAHCPAVEKMAELLVKSESRQDYPDDIPVDRYYTEHAGTYDYYDDAIAAEIEYLKSEVK